MADRFHVEFSLAPGLASLEGPEARHLATVLRARPGQQICLFNGDGAEYQAIVVEVQKKQVIVEVVTRNEVSRELPHQLIVAAPLPKADRGQFLIEKLTELGVTRFIPLKTARSVVHPAKLDRLCREVIEASKQCGRNRLMTVDDLTTWEHFLRDPGIPSLKLMAHFGGSAIPTWQGDVVTAVGPEGGWTDDEVAAAKAHGWQIVSLGPTILRVETAAIALASRLI